MSGRGMRDGDYIVTAVAGHFLLSKFVWDGLPHEALAVFTKYNDAIEAAILTVEGTAHQVFVNRRSSSRLYQALLIPTRIQESATALLAFLTCLTLA